MNAIVLNQVTKHFRKRTIRPQHTTFKTELVRWLTGKAKKDLPSPFIEALKGVDLAIPKGSTVGIIGRNGSGKSTLLKLMTGIYSPTSGSVEVEGRISALLDLGAGFHPDFSGRENIMINGIILGMTAREVRARVDEIIEFAELGDFIDEPVRTYSSGMYMRLAFAVATHVDPEILIIDEILAVGDEHFSKKSFAKMNEFKRSGKTLVLVTHDLATVQKWCDLAAWIDGGKTRLLGEPAFVVDQYRKAVQAAEAQSDATGHSALSSPGGALPDLPAASEDLRRTGSGALEISRVRLLDKGGKEAVLLDTEDGLEVRLDYLAVRPVSDASFSIELKRNDGLVIYSTSTAIERSRLPLPLSEKGTVHLHLGRLGLLAGEYLIQVAARSSSDNGQDSRAAPIPFAVKSSVADSGVARPPHRWSFNDQTSDGREVAKVVKIPRVDQPRPHAGKGLPPIALYDPWALGRPGDQLGMGGKDDALARLDQPQTKINVGPQLLEALVETSH